MQEIEAAAFARGVSARDLMEQAGLGIASVVRQFFPQPGLAVMYLGKGNNAGDALVVGRELLIHGWRIAARLSCEPSAMKDLPREHWQSLGDKVERWALSAPAHEHRGPVVILDGLLGIGATGALQGTLRELAAEMNLLRRECHATTVAMDIPSGLNGDSGLPCDDAVVADITATVAQVKTGLLADAATHHVGRLALVPLAELSAPQDERTEVITSTLVRGVLPRRNFDMHKGQAGRVTIVAGSRGYLGAAMLTSLGALRGGAGLITLLAKEQDYDLLAMKMPPEIMVRPVGDYAEAINGADVIAIGPGLGCCHDDAVLDIVRQATQPVVVDADALNAIARAGLPECRGPRLLTPHPGEMNRLIAARADWLSLDRRGQAEAYAAAHNVTLLLKGSRTVIATAQHPTRFNTTGTPGMASGGMGDVLTGLLAALVAQRVPLHEAASAGSWLLGRAGECALHVHACSPESVAATDVLAHLGQAFADARCLVG
jgi:NAD(P)H-hydrate epimerase